VSNGKIYGPKLLLLVLNTFSLVYKKTQPKPVFAEEEEEEDEESKD
jgi:hypothetical protein